MVQWKGVDSREYSVQKGVKQGSIMSPHLYKVYINDLLQAMQHYQIGAFIGTKFVGVPTCADDILLLSNDPFQLQTMLDISYQYTQEHQYQVHTQKSVTTQQVPSKQHSDCSWNLGSQEVTRADQFTHLGLVWRSGQIVGIVVVRVRS